MFKRQIDTVLIKALGGKRVIPEVRIQLKDLPQYRFVDLWNAVEEEVKSYPSVEIVSSSHQSEDLNLILIESRQKWQVRDITKPVYTPWPVGVGKEVYLPNDCFWILKKDKSTHADLIIRVRHIQHIDMACIELAGMDAEHVENSLSSIIKRSIENSIYRGQLIEISIESGTKDEYGDVERPDRLRVLFKGFQPVEDYDLVVEPQVLELLKRNVLDLHTNRTLLRKHGVPVRRGVLLYGPPGTGKTYACRYLCGRLPGVTKILVAGSSLPHVSSAFTLARMLQPTLIILEDVDLVFTSREINLYSSVMGDLLDQMDGLRPFEDISFVLTTNAIDRMEAAIKDRPGRISQLIRFDTPNHELRKRYLSRYLRGYNTENLKIDELAEMSDRTTQAFLKEWVHRAVQFAAEKLKNEEDELSLNMEDFTAALEEIKRYSDDSSAHIVGFR